MEGFQTNESQKPLTNTKREKALLIVQVLLRSLVIVCTAIAAWLVFTSKQTADVFGVAFSANYSDDPSTRFYAYITVVACIHSLASLGIVLFLRHRLTYFFLFLHDLVMTALVIAACAGAGAIGNVAAHGNTHTSWMPICDHFGKFCNRITASVIFSILAWLMFFVLTVLSALRMQSQTPLSCSS